jgi:hypothetical protein
MTVFAALQGYCVSKVLLEKEACRFAREHGISLVTVCSAVTVGAAPASKVHISVPASLWKRKPIEIYCRPRLVEHLVLACSDSSLHCSKKLFLSAL